MTGADRVTFARLLTDLFAAYRQKPDEGVVGSYWAGLEDLSLDELEAACTQAKKDSRFVPSVHTIRACVVTQAVDRFRTVDPQALAAYEAGEVHCRQCEDTGWAIETRASKFGDERSYASVCPCRPTNGIYQAKRALFRPALGRNGQKNLDE